ncbi:MAG: hypothetical protein MJ150_00720 [Clostridia bacterium]|nr:hypothetical protein [Clostridia bacterium]
MEIIALRGKSNTGKTETLKLLIDLICQEDLIARIDRKSDSYAVAKIDGRKVGIITAGDDVRTIERYIKYLLEIEKKIDILVIACHAGKTSDYLGSMYKKVSYIENAYFDEKHKKLANSLHQEMAHYIFNTFLRKVK